MTFVSDSPIVGDITDYFRLRELSVERRALLAALRDAGYPMGAIASAVGIARQNVYAILGPIDPSDQRKRGPAPKQ